MKDGEIVAELDYINARLTAIFALNHLPQLALGFARLVDVPREEPSLAFGLSIYE